MPNSEQFAKIAPAKNAVPMAQPVVERNDEELAGVRVLGLFGQYGSSAETC
jgi:hypothetical protein